MRAVCGCFAVSDANQSHFIQAALAIAIQDLLITLPDEIE